MLTAGRASAIRWLIRSLLILLTAFGLDLDEGQVAAIQLVGEALLQAHAQFFGGDAGPSDLIDVEGD